MKAGKSFPLLPVVRKLTIFSIGMLGLLSSMASANPPPDGEVTISPYDPNATWQAEHELQSGESVKFTVTVEDSGNSASGGSYQIEGNPEITYTEPNTLWTQTTNESPYVFNALNTGVTVLQDTVKLAVVWKEEGAQLGGGGGAAPEPDTLDGSAYGTVYSETAVFTWTCNPKLQFADGESVIDFTVSGSVNGAAVDLAGYTIAGEPGWTIAQNQNGNDIQGTVKSTTPSEGNLKIENAGNLQDTNPEKIGFAKLDLAIAAFGDGDDMEEDRQPGGGVAPAPHEMDPGGVVLAAFEESDATFTRTKLTLTGSAQNPGTNGTYTLSQENLTKVKIYDAPEDGNLIALDIPWPSAEFGAGKTLYLESDSFAEEDDPEEGTLKLTYQCEFDGNNEELSDEVKVSLLPVKFKAYPDDEPGPYKPHLKNLNTQQNEVATYGNYKKFVAHLWEEDDDIRLLNYLEGGDDSNLRELLREHLKFKSNGQLITFGGEPSHSLNFVGEPEENKIRFYKIEVLPKDGNEVLDRLMITVVPRSTKTAFDAWKENNQDLDWLSELPPLYSYLEEGQPVTHPVDGNGGGTETLWVTPNPSRNCDPPGWNSVKDGVDSHYHPAAAHEIRSVRTLNGHGHQACYDENRQLIREGVSAGTADKAYQYEIGEGGHAEQDVLPFIWAIQLDGNPVEGGLLNFNLNLPIAYEGAFAKDYLELRPPIANSKPELQPGHCP